MPILAPRFLAPRWFFSALTLLCAMLLAYGYYLQFHDGLEPCPMCIFQRLCYLGVAGVSLLGALHGSRALAGRVYAAVALLAAGIGAAIAGRQVWLQHLPPDEVPECGPGLEFMLEMYPLADVIRTALKGTGECAAVDWTFLGASIAEWSLLCFLGMAVALVTFLASTFRHNPS